MEHGRSGILEQEPAHCLHQVPIVRASTSPDGDLKWTGCPRSLLIETNCGTRKRSEFVQCGRVGGLAGASVERESALASRGVHVEVGGRFGVEVIVRHAEPFGSDHGDRPVYRQGIGLCVFPYLIPNPYGMVITGSILTAVPWLLKE